MRAVVLYPWRVDRRIALGRRRPAGKEARAYQRFGATLLRERGWWYAQFERDGLRRFYVEHLLYHEVGHHLDRYRRRWSRANRKQIEDAADEYAVRWSKSATDVLSRLDNAAG